MTLARGRLDGQIHLPNKLHEKEANSCNNLQKVPINSRYQVGRICYALTRAAIMLAGTPFFKKSTFDRYS